MEGSSKRTPGIIILIERCLPILDLSTYKSTHMLLESYSTHTQSSSAGPGPCYMLGDFPSEANDRPPSSLYPGAPLSIQVRSCEGV